MATLYPSFASSLACHRPCYSTTRQTNTVTMEAGKKTTALGVESAYGLKDALTYGLSGARKAVNASHPLEAQLQQDAARKQHIDMKILRATQGLHAGLRLNMERSAARKVGHLPFLPCHNALHDALTGNDLMLDFEDVLGNPADSEVMGQPHAMIEKQLGIL